MGFVPELLHSKSLIGVVRSGSGPTPEWLIMAQPGFSMLVSPAFRLRQPPFGLWFRGRDTAAATNVDLVTAGQGKRFLGLADRRSVKQVEILIDGSLSARRPTS